MGGTFTIKGASSLAQFESLVKVLRLAIYTHLSLLLEQHFLSDCHVKLRFPQPSHLIKPSPPIAPPLQSSVSFDSKRKPRDSLIPLPLWNFFSKKGSDLLHLATATGSPSVPRGSSLDLPRQPVSPSSPRSSEESPYRRIRRFSIFGETRPPPVPAKERSPPSNHPFQSALQRIEESKALLSTSTGVVFSPPVLLVGLAEKEKRLPTFGLTGEERTALSSVLGWNCKEVCGNGMSGTAGFVLQQSLSVLYSQYVPVPREALPAPSEKSSNSLKASDLLTLTPCGPRARWQTIGYYSEGQCSLGEMVGDACMRAEEMCDRPGCEYVRGHHRLQWIHNGVRIVAKTNPIQSVVKDSIEMWQSCNVCYETTPRCKMQDGT